MAERLLATRHAETTYNRARRVNGDPRVEVRLTQQGLEQAAMLRERLSGVEITTAVTTEFPRTVHTAEVALRGREVRRLTFRELNDPRLGSLEGADFGAYRRWRKEHAIDERIPGGGESQLDAVARYALGWRKVVELPGSVLVIAHAFPISVALTLSEEAPPYVRREYERKVVAAIPHEIDVARLASGLRGAFEELRAYGLEPARE